MKTDAQTRFLLGVIAVALSIIAAQSLVREARAADRLDCRIEGPIELRPITIRSIDGTVQVENKATYGAAGSSSTSPLYIRAVD